MWAYVVRRILMTVPIVLGILLITFVLFSYVAPDPAFTVAGRGKKPAQLRAIRQEMGLDKPVWLDSPAKAKADDREYKGRFNSQFFDVVFWRFPESIKYHQPVGELIMRKAPVSLAVQLPIFLIELGLQLILALVCAFNRGRWPDLVVTFGAVLGMCVPYLSIIILGQSMLGFESGIFPVAGWDTGVKAVHFMALPILVGVAAGLGGGVRFYRTVMLDEVYTDYVRTARAKGVSRNNMMLTHVLRNVFIPVVTQTVTVLPYLLLGSLLLERMFQIPGLGGLMVEALFNNDKPILMAMTYGISVAYCLMLMVTDIAYTLVDPRVRLS